MGEAVFCWDRGRNGGSAVNFFVVLRKNERGMVLDMVKKKLHRQRVRESDKG